MKKVVILRKNPSCSVEINENLMHRQCTFLSNLQACHLEEFIKLSLAIPWDHLTNTQCTLFLSKNNHNEATLQKPFSLGAVMFRWWQRLFAALMICDGGGCLCHWSRHWLFTSVVVVSIRSLTAMVARDDIDNFDQSNI